MNLMNMMKDEELGEAILYNFTKAYGKVPMPIYDVVLPLLYNDTFRDTISKYDTLKEVIDECIKEEENFTLNVLDTFEKYASVTSYALGMAMVHGFIHYELSEGQNKGVAKESPILDINEAKKLAEMMQGMSKEDVLAFLKDERLHIVVLQRDSVGTDVDMTIFETLGRVTYYSNTLANEVRERICDADIVITNKNLLGENLEGSKVKLICLTATGFNNIDIDYCKKHNIQLRNVKGYSTDTVAQHTLTMALHLLEHLNRYDQYIKSETYSREGNFSYFNEVFHDLSSLKWGIVGLGDIGKKVALIVKAFGADVQYYSTSGKNATNQYSQVDFDTLLKTSDIISLHCPLNSDTENLFDREAIAKMKPGALLINVARGKIVDEQALAEAIKEKRLGGIGFDVFETEPMTLDNPLLTLKDYDNVILTPHIAWASIEARTRCVNEVYKNVLAYIEGKERNNIV